MQLVTSEELEQMKANGDKILVDFYASWCGPCKTLASIIERNPPSIPVVEIDIDEDIQMAMNHKIRGVPTLILMQDGEEIRRKSGVLSSSELNKFIGL